MNKLDLLLNQVELFEKLAIAGGRKELLKSLAQNYSDVDADAELFEQFKRENAGSPRTDKALREEFDALMSQQPAQKPMQQTPTRTAPKPQVNLKAKADELAHIANVIKAYMNSPEYKTKNKDVFTALNKVWQTTNFSRKPAFSGNYWTELNAINSSLKEFENFDPNSMNPEQVLVDNQIKELLRLRQKQIQDMMV